LDVRRGIDETPVYQALGFLESIERESFVAIVHMYCDESGKKGDHPVVTFSGVCLPYGKLEGFDAAWNRLLLQYEIPHLQMKKASRLSDAYGPKMPRHQTPAQRTDALRPFADCINEHFDWGLLQAIDVSGFNVLTASKKKGLGSLEDPYYLTFMRGMLEIARRIHEDDRLSIICDDDSETAWSCYEHYRAVRKVHPIAQKKVVSLSFSDDRYFPGLQAADMVAFLARLEARRRFYRDTYYFVALFNHLVKQQDLKATTWLSAFGTYKKMKELTEKLK
jgi:hypothetical protein